MAHNVYSQLKSPQSVMAGVPLLVMKSQGIWLFIFCGNHVIRGDVSLNGQLCNVSSRVKEAFVYIHIYESEW